MRYLVLTDIHANLEALDTCLADAATRGYDRVLVLGDLIGYGADPNAVIERVQALKPTAIVRGNHDKVARGLDEAEGFNAVAKNAAQWTLDTLTPAHRDCLINLPQGPIVVDDMVEICHGSPYDEDAYIFDELDALRGLKTSTRPLCLFGHTHYPMTFELSGETSRAPDRRPRRKHAGASRRREVSAESGIGGTAARRRSARGVCDCRYDGKACD